MATVCPSPLLTPGLPIIQCYLPINNKPSFFLVTSPLHPEMISPIPRASLKRIASLPCYLCFLIGSEGRRLFPEDVGVAKIALWRRVPDDAGDVHPVSKGQGSR